MGIAARARRVVGADVPQRRCSDHYDGGNAGRLLAILFVASGLLTLVSPLLPTPPRFDSAGVVVVGSLATTIGLAAFLVPWGRWPRRVTLAGVPPALLLIVWHNLAGGVDAYRFGLFFLVVFVWIGMSHPRGTAVAFAPLALAAYVAPLVIRDAPTSAFASAAYAVPMYVAIGETLAWRSAGLRDSQRRLAHLAYHDPVTGLANRTSFQEALDDVLAGLGPADRCWVLFVDLDDFKVVNDTLGHAAGDDLLRDVGRALRQACPPGSGLCRWAGDEFTVLLPHAEEDEVAATVATIHRHLGWVRCGPGLRTSASVGVARIVPGLTSRQVIARADEAMYRDKARGEARPDGSGTTASGTTAGSVP